QAVAIQHLVRDGPLHGQGRLPYFMAVKLTEIDMGRHETQKAPSPGRCIYCGSTDELTDEHVVPFALAANSVIHLDASSTASAAIIQPYEQGNRVNLITPR